MENSNKVKYGNWVSGKIIKLLIILSVFLAAGCGYCFIIRAKNSNVEIIYLVTLILLILAIVSIGMTVYMTICRRLFSYTGKYKIQNKILDYLISYLQFSKGKVLDIGCGNGALSIKLAKKFKNSKVTSIDYWGKEWEFAKEQCEKNAKVEGVDKKITFKKGDAAKLEFDNEAFDAVVSNFVFHEVKSEKDKRLVVKEALRVLKKGGTFAFHDLFLEEKIYGNIDEFIKELKSEGISEVKIAYSNSEKFIPNILKTRFMLGRIAVIYGIK